MKNDPDGAIAEYRKAIALDRRYAAAIYNLGHALYRKKDLNGAIAAFRRVIEIDPKHFGAHYNLGNVLLEQARV